VQVKVALGHLGYLRGNVSGYDLQVIRIGERVWHRRSVDAPGLTALSETVHDLQGGNRLLF